MLGAIAAAVAYLLLEVDFVYDCGIDLVLIGQKKFHYCTADANLVVALFVVIIFAVYYKLLIGDAK